MRVVYCPVVAEIVGKTYFFVVKLDSSQKDIFAHRKEGVEAYAAQVAEQIAERIQNVLPENERALAFPTFALLTTLRVAVIARTTPESDAHLQGIIQNAGEEGLKAFLLKIV